MLKSFTNVGAIEHLGGPSTDPFPNPKSKKNCWGFLKE